uniref:Zgc:113176 n=1 Tax=Amphilophus citrinellus TaxID=61819 RepID=A0A3Q0S959_AMPCI
MHGSCHDLYLSFWIGNHGKSLKVPSGPTPQKTKLYSRSLSAYNLFCRDLLRNKGENISYKNSKWSSLGEAEKNKYHEEAAAVKAEGQTQHLSPETRELKVKKHLKQLKFEVSSLEKLGVETAVMSFDCQRSNLEVSSKGAAAFLDSTDTLNSFALHFKGSSSTASAFKEPVDALAKKVIKMFNKKYNEAGGIGRVPYLSLQNHSITINAVGLPDGLTVKKPSCYGRKQLEFLDTFSLFFSSGAQSAEEAVETSESSVLSILIFNKSSILIQQPHFMCFLVDSYFCCICHAHFNDKQKNTMKKWCEWHQCSACKLWSHMTCGFKKNMCIRCQDHTS